MALPVRTRRRRLGFRVDSDLGNDKLGANGTVAEYLDESGITHGGDATAVTVSALSGGGTDGDYDVGVTTRGTITLSSAANFTLGGTDLAAGGLDTAAASLTRLGWEIVAFLGVALTLAGSLLSALNANSTEPDTSPAETGMSPGCTFT